MRVSIALRRYLPDGLGWRGILRIQLRSLRAAADLLLRKVLGVRPLEDAREEYRFGSRELGSLVHEILEHVFRDLERRNGCAARTTRPI